MLGDKIRKIRKSEQMTVSALAEKTGVSESYISQLERGLVDPSVSLLRKLAFVLHVSVASFFDEDGDAPIITRIENREQLTTEDSAASLSWISPEAENLRLEMVEFCIHPGKALALPQKNHHVCLFLTDGSACAAYGDTQAELQAGDSIFIPADTAFTISAGNDCEARGLLCVSKGGC